jgi:DNA-binding GntR family transcriptional regulator
MSASSPATHDVIHAPAQATHPDPTHPAPAHPAPAHPAAHPAHQPAASERVYEHVKHGILDGHHPGGTLLTEGELAEAVGVSRTPVREALLRLAAEGLVRLYPKKGALVVPVTLDEGRELLEARSVIESWAAQACWPRRTEVHERLLTHLEGMRTARQHGDILGFAEQDRLFHEAVVAAGGNAILLRTYRGLRDRQLCLLAADLRMSQARMDASLAAHETLVRELATGTPDSFRHACLAHIEGAAAALRGPR